VIRKRSFLKGNDSASIWITWLEDTQGFWLLSAVSLIWGFSFGLIKGQLTDIPSGLVSFLRLIIAWLLFLPFARRVPAAHRLIPRLMGIGLLQFGLMYLLYIQSFQYLLAWEVALFTIFTPLYVTFFNDLLQRKINVRFFIAALLSVIALAILKWKTPDSEQFLPGFLLVQGSNLSFAMGQIAYKRTVEHETLSDLSLMHWLYLGGSLGTLAFSFQTLPEAVFAISIDQWLVLFYLGAIASGVGFWFWNAGGRKVNAGTLAVFNNLKIPLAMIISILFFGESAPIMKLMATLAILSLAMLLPIRK
jgi:drug/metabolite transporter (DMT)-like permease